MIGLDPLALVLLGVAYVLTRIGDWTKSTPWLGTDFVLYLALFCLVAAVVVQVN